MPHSPGCRVGNKPAARTGASVRAVRGAHKRGARRTKPRPVPRSRPFERVEIEPCELSVRVRRSSQRKETKSDEVRGGWSDSTREAKARRSERESARVN